MTIERKVPLVYLKLRQVIQQPKPLLQTSLLPLDIQNYVIIIIIIIIIINFKCIALCKKSE
jgi:hypothetical protein